MDKPDDVTTELTRRAFTRQLSVAALSGALAGAGLLGCKADGDAKVDDKGAGTGAKGGEAPTAGATNPLLTEPHVCRGLNSCKGKGKGGGNACGGQGDCSTATAHACAGKNECKGQGGCGGKTGSNDCKGTGGCGVPLGDHAWGKTRERFEGAAKEAGITVGQAPAKK